MRCRRLPLLQVPPSHDLFATRRQGAKFLGYDALFGNRSFFEFSGEKGDFLSAMAAPPEFFFALAATHLPTP
jgi:hypothetical protein